MGVLARKKSGRKVDPKLFRKATENAMKKGLKGGELLRAIELSEKLAKQGVNPEKFMRAVEEARKKSERKVDPKLFMKATENAIKKGNFTQEQIKKLIEMAEELAKQGKIKKKQ